MNQQKLFHAGSGQRPREAAFVIVGQVVTVRLDGVKLVSPNANHTATRGSRYAELGRIKRLKGAVMLAVRAAVGVGSAGELPRVVITRRSFGELDRDNAWSSAKPVFDGVAMALGLADDRALQKLGDVVQEKCARGTFGVVITIDFGKAGA